MDAHTADLDERSRFDWLRGAAKFEKVAARCWQNPAPSTNFRKLAADARDKAQSMARTVAV